MNIYVSNLSFAVQDEDLRDFFAEYGAVTSAKVIMDKTTNRSRGFGFVEMPNDAEGQKAIDSLDGASADCRTMRVTVAKPREERSSGGSSNGGGGRRSFSGSNSGGSRW
jgi:RNA recognition motif-containing protein